MKVRSPLVSAGLVLMICHTVQAQVAGSTLVGITVTEMQDVAVGAGASSGRLSTHRLQRMRRGCARFYSLCRISGRPWRVGLLMVAIGLSLMSVALVFGG
jgi:predicted lysophospholipase L1 biosynthesis ABC-type transport system permease subunit